jgi:dihydrofolate reductase
MRKIIAAEYLTLDGVMSDPAWTVPYWSDELAALQEELFNECDLLLLGRITYDGMSKAWPAMADAPGAAGMNSIPKLVATRTLTQLEWNAGAIQGDLVEALEKVKQQSGKNILIYGSGELVRSLMKHDLIDEYRLMVYPIVLGQGKRLFVEGSETTLTLNNSVTTDKGVIVLTYQLAG